MTADLIVPGLYVGNAPPLNLDWSSAPARRLVLTAKELHKWQTPDKFPGAELLYVPMDDDYNKPPSPTKVALILAAAQQVAQWLLEDKSTVVTCHEGRNRSGLVAALALVLSNEASPEEAVHLIRAARGPLALQNPQFLKLLYSLRPKTQLPIAS